MSMRFVECDCGIRYIEYKDPPWENFVWYHYHKISHTEYEDQYIVHIGSQVPYHTCECGEKLMLRAFKAKKQQIQFAKEVEPTQLELYALRARIVLGIGQAHNIEVKKKELE